MTCVQHLKSYKAVKVTFAIKMNKCIIVTYNPVTELNDTIQCNYTMK